MDKRQRVGFMQGRLSPLIDGKIQAFPWPFWQAEFPAAAAVGLRLMEWTIDQDRLFENPIMTETGRAEIRDLMRETGVSIPSLTGDCFMQAPFWKVSGAARDELLATFRQLLVAVADVGVRYIVVPLVDNGSLTNAEEEAVLVTNLLGFELLLAEHDQVIAFESDFPPARLAEFIARLPADRFGINYDTGNSASLGWKAEDEIPALASRIVNVHIKDRLLGGTTVPLGQGAADLPKSFELLKSENYRGNYILQTARATADDHAEVLGRYNAFVLDHIG